MEETLEPSSKLQSRYGIYAGVSKSSKWEINPGHETFLEAWKMEKLYEEPSFERIKYDINACCLIGSSFILQHIIFVAYAQYTPASSLDGNVLFMSVT